MRYSQEFQRLLEYAAYDCSQIGAPSIVIDHLMLGLFREDFPLVDEVFATFRVDSMKVLERLIDAQPPSSSPVAAESVTLAPEALRAIAEAEREAERLGHSMLTPPHTLVGILAAERGRLQHYFIREEIVHRREDEVLERVRELVSWLRFTADRNIDRDLEVLSADTIVGMESMSLGRASRSQRREYAVQLRLLKRY